MISDERLDHFAVHDEEITWNWTKEEKAKLLRRSEAVSRWYDSDILQEEYRTCDDYLKSLGDSIKQVD